MGSLQKHREGRRGRDEWLWLTVILVVTTGCCAEGTTKSWVHHLREKLFENYDKLVRPVVHQNTTTEVKVGLAPLAIADLDEDKQIIHLDSWISMAWKDEYLSWNPEKYGGVTLIHVPSTEIWRPDIAIYSGSPAKAVIVEALPNANIYSSGYIIFVPPHPVRSRCPQDAESNEDSLICTIEVGSWTYSESKMDLTLRNHKVDLDNFKNTNPYWELISATVERRSKYYSCCHEPYVVHYYNITVKRRSPCKALRKSCCVQEISRNCGL